MSVDVLRRPLALASGLVLPNRLAKAAMSEVLADASGGPSDRLVRLYERLGRGGAGMLITGHVIVDAGGLGEPGNVLVEDERHLPALRRWAEAAQAGGSRLFMQLNHTGRQSPRKLTREPVAPSSVPLRGFFGVFAKPRALAEDEILALIRRFATAAAVAKEAGFAGVQIHGAHGYLVSQFLSPLANVRTDAWGGDVHGRMRFLIEIVRAMRAAVGPAFPIAVKLNSADFQRGGFEVADAKIVAQALEAEGVDLLEISGGNYESPAMAGGGERRASTAAREAYFLEYARDVRSVTTLPLMLTGGFRTAKGMADAVASGAVDVVGLARPISFEPDLPRRILSGDTDTARALDLSTGVRKLDDMLQVFWFQQQLHRMADGREPDPSLGRLCALATGVRHAMLPGAAPAPGAPREATT